MNRFLLVAFGVALGAGGTVAADSYALPTKADVYAPLSTDHVTRLCLDHQVGRAPTDPDAGILDAGSVEIWTVTTRSCVPADGVEGLAPDCGEESGPVAPEAIDPIKGLLRAYTLGAHAAKRGFRVAP